MSGARLDRFLDGRVEAWQPGTGFRSGLDAVLLAAGVPAKAGEAVLELGVGSGVAAMCLAARTGAVVTGLERHPEHAALARRNGLDVIEGDVAAMPPPLRARRFDHVMANPPFYDRRRGTRAPDPAREDALGEDVPLPVWIDAGLRRLAPRGTLTVILPAHRLGDGLRTLDDRAGSVRVLPVAPQEGRPATRVLVQARKGGQAPLVLLPPFVLHGSDGALGHGDTHTDEANAVLRGGGALPIGKI